LNAGTVPQTKKLQGASKSHATVLTSALALVGRGHTTKNSVHNYHSVYCLVS